MSLSTPRVTTSLLSIAQFWSFFRLLLLGFHARRLGRWFFDPGADFPREGKQVKRELEESRCRYMKCKITLEETLPSLKEMVDKFDGGSSSPKIKSEWLDLQKAPRGLFREL